MYITDWRLDAIVKLHKLTGEQEEILTREPQTNRLYGVKIFSESVQHVDFTHPCAFQNNCEKLCFAVPANGEVGRQLTVNFKFLRTYFHFLLNSSASVDARMARD